MMTAGYKGRREAAIWILLDHEDCASYANGVNYSSIVLALKR